MSTVSQGKVVSPSLRLSLIRLKGELRHPQQGPSTVGPGTGLQWYHFPGKGKVRGESSPSLRNPLPPKSPEASSLRRRLGNSVLSRLAAVKLGLVSTARHLLGHTCMFTSEAGRHSMVYGHSSCSSSVDSHLSPPEVEQQHRQQEVTLRELLQIFS